MDICVIMGKWVYTVKWGVYKVMDRYVSGHIYVPDT